jgi:hypothetical protein
MMITLLIKIGDVQIFWTQMTQTLDLGVTDQFTQAWMIPHSRLFNSHNSHNKIVFVR